MPNSIDNLHSRTEKSIAVIIPSYKVKKHILDVISRIGPEVSRIYVVDDACPEQSGRWVEQHSTDLRTHVLYNEKNSGVGGAMKTGYIKAIQDGIDIAVKIDGDGQMAPELINLFVKPIINGTADYTKGNRFFDLENINRMPRIRIIGNAILSFLSKLSSGYWQTFDPTNGFTAIHTEVLRHIPLKKISNRYFFESDMLFRLNLVQAKVVDIPMDALYADETSGLEIKKILGEFLTKHTRNFIKRIFYNYFLRNFSAASIELVAAIILTIFGAVFGVVNWVAAAKLGISSSAGTVMISAMPIIIGIQLLLSFLSYDIQSTPSTSLWPRLDSRKARHQISNRTDEAENHA